MFVPQSVRESDSGRDDSRDRELLQQIATTAFQSVQPARARRDPKNEGLAGADPARKPAILDTCVAYGTDSPVVRKMWPQFYTGPVEEHAPAEETVS